MADPLIFLTSTSTSIPSGRNARAAARASMFRHSTQPTSVRGTFNVFLAAYGPEIEKDGQKSISLGSLAGKQSQSSFRRARSKKQRAENIPRMLGPQTITIEELLGFATTRIKHDLTLTLKKQPSRARDVLRCRQWAVAAFAFGNLCLTPEIHSAVEYLEHKVRTIQHPEQPRETELRKYGVALSELQQSLQDPERRLQPSVLAASHILAICEMLGDTTSNNYLNFVGGIVTLSSLQARKGNEDARLYHCSNAGPIMIEALLAKRSDAILNQPWSETLLSAGTQGYLPKEDALCSADGAELILSRAPATHLSPAPRIPHGDRILLIARARRLQSTLKQSIQSSLLIPGGPEYICPRTGTICGQIAVMLGLDDFISQIAEGNDDPSELLHNDNCKFYADAISAL